MIYKYKLINELAGSNKYGDCEICGKYADTIYHQIEYKKYINQDRSRYFQLNDAFGHKDCLLNIKKGGEKVDNK